MILTKKGKQIMGSEMQIDVSQREGRVPITLLHIKGRIDGDNFEQLQTQADEAIETGTRNLLLDLTEVNFISSAGIRAIHTIFKQLQTGAANEADAMSQASSAKSPHLKLLNPPPEVRRIFKAVGFDIFLEIYDNLDEAVASF